MNVEPKTVYCKCKNLQENSQKNLLMNVETKQLECVSLVENSQYNLPMNVEPKQVEYEFM